MRHHKRFIFFHEGEFIGPFVYSLDYKLNMEILRREYTDNLNVVQPLRFFCRGDVYEFWSLFETDFHLICAAKGGTFFFLGTDRLGRDILSRLIFGARTALSIGFFSAFIGCSIGAIIGIVSAFAGGKVDILVQRGIDLLLSFPIIILAILVIAIVPKNVVFGIDINVIIAISIPFIPKCARVIRSAALSIVTLAYVDAAKAAGYKGSRIVFRHILPNVVAPYLILITAYIGQAILLEASLSFLGLGVVEPTPSWGLMLAGVNSDYYITAPWMIVFPGLAVTLAVFAFNLLGDSLRDWLDPKLKL